MIKVNILFLAIVNIMACDGLAMYDLVVSADGKANVQHRVMDKKVDDAVIRLNQLLPLPLSELMKMHFDYKLEKYLLDRLNDDDVWGNNDVLSRFIFNLY